MCPIIKRGVKGRVSLLVILPTRTFKTVAPLLTEYAKLFINLCVSRRHTKQKHFYLEPRSDMHLLLIPGRKAEANLKQPLNSLKQFGATCKQGKYITKFHKAEKYMRM